MVTAPKSPRRSSTFQMTLRTGGSAMPPATKRIFFPRQDSVGKQFPYGPAERDVLPDLAVLQRLGDAAVLAEGAFDVFLPRRRAGDAEGALAGAGHAVKPELPDAVPAEETGAGRRLQELQLERPHVRRFLAHVQQAHHGGFEDIHRVPPSCLASHSRAIFSQVSEIASPLGQSREQRPQPMQAVRLNRCGM